MLSHLCTFIHTHACLLTHRVHCFLFELVSYLNYMFHPNKAIIIFMNMYKVVSLLFIYSFLIVIMLFVSLSDEIVGKISKVIFCLIKTDKTNSKAW
jgi:hypothetical protein